MGFFVNIKNFFNYDIAPMKFLLILTGINLFNYLDRYILAAVVGPMKAELLLTDAEVGRLSTVFMIGYIIFCPLFGYLGDKITRKWLIIAGIFIWSIATVNTGLAMTFSAVLLWRTLVGIGEASYATICPGLISDKFSKEQENKALTIFLAAVPIGSAIGYSLGGVMAAKFGWREAFIFAGAPGLILAFILAPFRDPERKKSNQSESINMKAVLQLLKMKNYNLICWGYTAYHFSLGAIAFWGPTFLNRAHNIPTAKAAMLFGAILVVAGFAGTLFGGFLGNYFQKKGPAGFAKTCAGSILLAAPVSFLALWTDSQIVSLIALGLAMFLVFLPTGPINTLIIQAVPGHLKSIAMAIVIFALHFFGDMWSPEIVGRLADHWGKLELSILILPPMFVVAGVFWGWLAYRHSHNTEASEVKV